MANVIRLKRRPTGGSAGAPASLKTSEPAYNEVDGKLYLGVGNDGSDNATSIPAIVLPTASQAEAEAGTATDRWLTPQRWVQAFNDRFGPLVAAFTGKTTPVGADEIGIGDSAASGASKKVTLTNLFAQFMTIASSLLSTAAEFLDNTSGKLLTPAAMHGAVAHQSVVTFSSTITVDPTAGLSIPIGQATSDFTLTFSPAIPDGWTVELRINTSAGVRRCQFETGSVLMGEAFVGTRQVDFAASSTYLVMVRRAKDNSGTSYNQVSYIKEGA